jgi:molybdopterin-guanine dinucleotide biosynthesis protein A
LELIKKTSVLILAAGQSIRMGRPKFMLMYNEKYTFLEKMCLDYSKCGFSEIKVVLNPQGEELIK